MKYRAWHIDGNPNDGATIEAVDESQAAGIYQHDTGKPADEIICVPLLAAPVEISMKPYSENPQSAKPGFVPCYIVDGQDFADSAAYLRLFNGAPRMLELLLQISKGDAAIPLITIPQMQEALKLVVLILGESKS